MMEEMSAKMKEEIMEEMKKLGIEERMIDERLVWGSKKMMMGVTKAMMSLKENGMEEEEAKETIKKMLDSMMQKEMMEKSIAMMEDWKKEE